MHYIVGLGNPGDEYADTRHNVGFYVVKGFIEEMGLPSLSNSAKYSGGFSQGMIEGSEIRTLLPLTFMNASGSSVSKLVSPQEAHNLLVVYDDIDLPLGEYKVSFGRGDGGHNGVASIRESLGTKDFARLRIGVGKKSLWTGGLLRPKGKALASFVLHSFSPKELQVLNSLTPVLYRIMTSFVTEGIEKTMNRFN